MIKQSFILFIALVSSNSLAKYDLNLSTSLRSYPSASGSIDIEGGHSQMLWGQAPSGDSSSPMFGLIRTSLAASSSIVVHDYNARITLYPISFLGLAYGRQEMTSNHDDFNDYDCDTTRCEGTLKRDYLLGKIALGFGKFIGTYQYLESRNAYSYEDGEVNLPVAEYGFVVLANPKNDKHIQRTYFIGYKLGDDLIGAVSNQATFLESEEEYALNFLFYKTKMKNVGTTFGLGSFHTSSQKPGLSAILKLNYEFSKSLALF